MKEKHKTDLKIVGFFRYWCHSERSRGVGKRGFDFAQPDKRYSVSVLYCTFWE
ncbi:hypothetical protein [Capnocytophaga cynodegmi]|uniref:hypothetical protein n=1 Tax=Capnocytophaga cynodegmi TaxID=28189 RepID=UPI0038672461